MNNLAALHWHVYPDTFSLARAAADRILHLARLAIGRKGSFNIVLAGGQTPLHTYRYLARSDAQWSDWHVFFSDERCLEKGDPQRNDALICEHWLDEVAIPASQINHMLAHAGFDVAVSDYDKKLRGHLPFDLVLLGVGEDGHTASLFPGHQHSPALQVVPVQNSPKPPHERVSLNYPVLCEAREVMFLLEGSNKQAAVKAWQAGEALPVSRIQGRDETRVYIGADAMVNDDTAH